MPSLHSLTISPPRGKLGFSGGRVRRAGKSVRRAVFRWAVSVGSIFRRWQLGITKRPTSGSP
jgi:hypothetical protein